MNEIYNIRKLENLKEYLNQRMVSPRLLNNPRIYEILDEISKDFNLIYLDEEMKQILDEQLSVKNGKITYLKDNKRVKISRNNLGIETSREAFNKKDSSVISEKRSFDKDGIEYCYEISEGNLSWEDFKNNVGFIPLKKVTYSRDNDLLNFITKEVVDRFVVKEHMVQQTPYMLQNIKLNREELSRLFNNYTRIDDLYLFLTNSQAEFDTLKELFCEDKSKGQEEIFKTYCSYNRRFQLPTIYENGVAKRLGLNIQKIK